jgi:nucleoside-triphosphatase THEP1
VVIDEVGKMELASAAFRGAVQRLFDTGCSLVGTVHTTSTHSAPPSNAGSRWSS